MFWEWYGSVSRCVVRCKGGRLVGVFLVGKVQFNRCVVRCKRGKLVDVFGVGKVRFNRCIVC